MATQTRRRLSFKKYLDDICILIGFILILIGTFQLSPVATWFVGGGMMVLAGLAVGWGSRRTRK